MIKTIAAAALCAGLIATSAAQATASPITFHVDVNTAPLMSNPAGPFALDFQLIGTAGNTATVNGFTFGGGSAVGAPVLTGGALGSLNSNVILSDSVDFFNELFQQFTPGTTLGFNVSLTNLDPGPGFAPDAFSFAILDSSLFEIPTTGVANKLLTVDITRLMGIGEVQTYASVTPAGVDAIASEVPEPGSLLLLGLGLVGLAARRRASFSALSKVRRLL